MKYRLHDFLLFFLAATLILIFSSLPTWAGRSAQTNDLSFSGLFYDTPDYAVHLAMMQSGMQGNWAYQMRFTSEEHKPATTRIFYVVLGHIGKVLNLSTENTYHLFRWLMGYTSLLTIFLLCKYTFDSKFLYWCAFILAVMGSGLGWLQLLIGWIPGQITPIDFWLSDAYVFFSISAFPHFSFVITLMVFSLLLYLRYLETFDWKLVIFISLTCVLGQLVNPIAFVVVDVAIFVISACFWWKDNKKYKQLPIAIGIIAMAQIPLLIYNISILAYDPFWSQFTAQNLTPSPPPVYYLMGFGLLLPFMIVGAIDSIRKRNPLMLGMFGWVVSAFFLAYIPFNIQRRFLLAVTIPLAILAIHGLDILLRYFGRKSGFLKLHHKSIFITLLFFASFSSIYLSLGNVAYMKTRPTDYFYPSTLDPALLWLQDNADQEDFVLSAANTGLLVAQKSGLKVYLGHEMETLSFEAKQENVALAYQMNFPESILSALPVDWVIYGPFEQKIAPDFDPGSNLNLVYQFENVSIYRVNK